MDYCTISTCLQVDVWLWEATDPSSVGGGQGAVLGTRFSASGIPDTAGYRGRDENRMGALEAAQSAPGPKGEEGRGRGHWVVHTRSLVQSVAGAQEGLPVGG